jgi:hypothetical protein
MKKDKNPKTSQVPRIVDRFDLEQQILTCWSMVDDLRAFANSGATTDEFQALARVYDRKFDILFDTFSTMISEGQFAEHIRQTPEI